MLKQPANVFMTDEDLPRDIAGMAAMLVVAIRDLEPSADENQKMILTLCRATYASGQAKGIDFARKRAEALS